MTAACSKNWCRDCNFKVCREVFYQWYTFHEQPNGRIFRPIFALLLNKTEAFYKILLITISNLTNGGLFAGILIDSERGAINAFQAAFTNANVNGCFFHLCFNVWKHVQNFELQLRYVEKPEFALQLRMLTALAFLLPQDVARGFVAVCNEIRTNFGNVANKLQAYFQNTYVGRFFRLNAPRNNPMFLIELWNMFHRTDAELPQTSNSVEGWHRSFQGNLSSCHPNVWKFLHES